MAAVARPLTREQIRELLHSLELLRESVRAGELSAPAATIHRLEGAITALEQVLGPESQRR